MKKINVIIYSFVIASCVGLFFSCSKENSSTTTLQIKLTDAPTALQEVNVEIKEVLVKFSDDSLNNDGWVALTTNAGVYNLLALQNGVDTLLGTGTFSSSIVKEIRLVLGTNNTVKNNGTIYTLQIPSGDTSGLKIKVNKSLQKNLETLIVDFDAALSVKQDNQGNYKLRPVLRIK